MTAKLWLLSVVYGLVSYWNWKELQLYLRYEEYRPINFTLMPYLGGTFRNIGSYFVFIFVLYIYPFPESLLTLLGCAIGYFIGGMFFNVCMPFSGLIGKFAILFYIILLLCLLL